MEEVFQDKKNYPNKLFKKSIDNKTFQKKSKLLKQKKEEQKYLLILPKQWRKEVRITLPILLRTT